MAKNQHKKLNDIIFYKIQHSTAIACFEISLGLSPNAPYFGVIHDGYIVQNAKEVVGIVYRCISSNTVYNKMSNVLFLLCEGQFFNIIHFRA